MIDWSFDKSKEKKIIEQIKKEFGVKEIFRNQKIIFAKGNKTEAFLISKEIEEELKNLDGNPYTLGLYLGRLRNGKLKPSFMFVWELGKYSENKIKVEELEEQEFLYGHNLVNIYEKEGKFILENENGPIGLAEIDKEKVENVKDAGEYLRHGY